MPNQSALTKALKDIKSVYSEDYANHGAGERKALAAKLLKNGAESQDDPVTSFAELCEARDIAASVVDMKVAMEAITDLSRQFAIAPADVAQMKVSAFKTAKSALQAPGDAVTLAEAALTATDGLIETDDFAAAEKLAQVAQEAAESGHENSLYDIAHASLRNVQARKVEYENLVKANTILASNPNDPAALSISGRYACLITDNWVGGLPMLLKGSDQNLANAARAEKADPTDLAGMQKAGDAWWVAQAPLTGVVKAAALKRAELWYGRAANLATGFTKDRIQQRIKEVDVALARVSPSHVVNLLSMVDPAKDTVAGQWFLKDGALVSQQAPASRVQLPYEPPEEYDFIVEFSEAKPSTSMVQIIATKASQGVWAFVWPNQCNLGNITASGADNPHVANLPALQPNTVYRSLLQVRRGSFRAYVDGELVIQLSKDFGTLAMQKYWQLPDSSTLGVGGEAPMTIFSRIDVVEVSGPGKRLR